MRCKRISYMILFLKKAVRKFSYAFAGLLDGIMNDASIRLQFLLGACTLLAGLLLNLSLIEWSIVLILVALVIAMEYINSAIETITDVLFPNYDRRAKKIKDYSAAAVLVVSLVALLFGFVIFGGRLWTILM